MSIGAKLAEFSVRRYKLVTGVMVLVTLLAGIGAAIPSIFPGVISFLHPVRVDTDPENMLSEKEAVRVFHNQMKKLFSLHDIVVVGIVNEKNPDGVFNPGSLQRIYELTQYAKTLQWQENGKTEGVVEVDLIAPSTVDNIEQGGLGVVRFEWLMPQPPKTRDEALAIRDKAQHIPFLNGTLVSEDGKAVCLYLPLTRKDLSHRVYTALRKKIATFSGDDKFYITGLPVAEDVFGVEMFIQMAVSAPLAMIVIFLLMLAFFRKLVLIISPMIIAICSVIFTMGLLIIFGYPVHIMSSMIPIFIMPIAVLDAIHILSDFFEHYQATKDRRKTIVHVMDHLYLPMLYTSLTSAAGFASLALTPIPPVQVFGVFVAIGIMFAWVITVTFIPAYVMFISPKTLEKFGAVHDEHAGEAAETWMSRKLRQVGAFTFRRAKGILAVTCVVMVVAAYGITLIEINDNPVKWFVPSHPIRKADTVLNRHFGGTYMAYLALEAPKQKWDPQAFVAEVDRDAQARLKQNQEEIPNLAAVFGQLPQLAKQAATGAGSRKEAIAKLADLVARRLDAAPDEQYDAWDAASLFVDAERQRSQIFKQPEVLRYVGRLQQALRDTHIVGKSNSIADIVKTVHRELLLGKQEEYRIPDTHQAVAQCLITYQNSHRANDLWHFVTPDYRTSSIWVQLTSGDNKDMTAVAGAVEDFFKKNPPPDGIKHEWFGLTYINVIWQDKMVWGMFQAFAGSFLVVFLLMTILFRSALWGLLSMVPLTLTIFAIYGGVGLIGKAYDMPVAVLSSLSLGLAVDFAIHFLARGRRFFLQYGSWEKTAPIVFGEPARAITRNIIVIALGFTPLLFAPLMPYKTVGVLLATILLFSGVATMLILPALIRLLEKPLFAVQSSRGVTCSCVTCIASAAAFVALVAVNLHQYAGMAWMELTWGSAIAVPIFAIACGLLSRRAACKTQPVSEGDSA